MHLILIFDTNKPTAFIGALDGIYVQEELKVLYCRKLVNARNSMFPRSPPLNADQFIPYTKEVITSKNYILHCEKKRAELEKKTTNHERDEEEGADELYTACGGE